VGAFAIGDLHGCPEELEALLETITPGPDDTLVFLGDYVDRGPAVRALVERLIRLRSEGPHTVFLRGNHEDMLLDYLGFAGRYGEAYLANGGTATLASYGIPRGVRGSGAAEYIPPDHLQFLLDLHLTWTQEPFLCVHAGIRPGVALAQQDAEDLVWIREEFFTQRHALPYVVLFGHTPHREVRLDLPYSIGLDTGLVYGNKLSCLDLDRRRLLQVARGSGRVVARDLAPLFGAAGL